MIKVLSILEACFDLISSPSPSKSWAGKFLKCGVQIPAPEGQKKNCPFSVHFQILHKKLHSV